MHEVQALIAKGDVLAAEAVRFKRAVVCALVQGFSLLPVTDDLVSELESHRATGAATSAKPIQNLPDGLHALALEISQRTPTAYISTYYFGGRGGQDALAWDRGRLTFSPATPGYDQAWPHSPISQALRTIGVVAASGMDEFDTVGLGQHRETHRWAQSAR